MHSSRYKIQPESNGSLANGSVSHSYDTSYSVLKSQTKLSSSTDYTPTRNSLSNNQIKSINSGDAKPTNGSKTEYKPSTLLDACIDMPPESDKNADFHNDYNINKNGDIATCRRSSNETSLSSAYTSPRDKPGPYLGRPCTALLCLGFLSAMAVYSQFVLAYIHDYVPRENPPLPDVWFYFIPEWPAAVGIAEACMGFCCLFALWTALSQPARALITSRAFFLAGVLYLGRSICMSITLLPIPSAKYFCAPQTTSPSIADVLNRVSGMLAGLGTESSGFRNACGDLIFSGHTMAIMLSHCVIVEYTRITTPLTKRVVLCVVHVIATSGIVCLMWSRIHYSIDVVIAYYLTTRLFWMYHAAVDSGSVGLVAGRSDIISRVFWYPFVRYIEGW